MRIFINILGICSHMMLKDKVECQNKLTRALSKAAARLPQVGSCRPSMQVLPYQIGTAGSSHGVYCMNRVCFVQVDLKLKGP